jgi:hypothetical protein
MDFYITLKQLADLLGMSHETTRRWQIPHKEYHRRELGPFPIAHGKAQPPAQRGTGAASPVYLMSEVFDWLAENRPYDLRAALRLGDIGRDLARLDERDRDRQSSKASRAST